MNNKGFTLIELLVVIAIIGILATIVISNTNQARENAQITRALIDLREIRRALDTLTIDTGLLPTVGATKLDEETCVFSGTGNELYLNTSAAGIESTDGNFPGWNGPYMTPVPLDPWGNQYIFDSDYDCDNNANGCEGFSGQTVRAIHSSGPNGSALNIYDADNIVLVLCAE